MVQTCKMLRSLKNAWIIFILSRMIADASARCVGNFKVENWEFDALSSPPANLEQNLTVSKRFGNQTGIEVWLKDRREDFYFTLFADPFIKNESDCPPRLKKHKNLRQFFDTCTVPKNGNESASRFFGSIFTGCYYFVMTNKEGNKWQHSPIFYNTSYPYLNTQLELSEHYSFKPEETDSTMELRVLLKVPLSCVRVKAELFQHQSETQNAMAEIKEGRVPVTQKCFFHMNKTKVEQSCETPGLFTNLSLAVHAEERDRYGWVAKMVWEKLQRGGGNYYLHIVGNPTYSCPRNHGPENISTWMSIDREILRDYGSANFTNIPTKDPAPRNPFWYSIWYAVIGGLVFAISFYWAWKYHRIAWDYFLGKLKKPGPDPVPELPPRCKESSKILLLYGKGSPEFMEEMSDLRDRLAKNCVNCSVHDVYATSEWNRVSELGGAGWIHELLTEGCKVVWVDTPQFRSRFNAKERYAAQDFRDNTILYAACVTTDLFQNATTQYRRHFVVRVKGYEIQDTDDDPLKVVSPHARYHIPEQFSLLCEQLTPMKSLKTTGDKEMGMFNMEDKSNDE